MTDNVNLSTVLSRLAATITRINEVEQPLVGCPPKTLATVKEKVLAEFGVTLPEEHLRLLAQTDGFVFDGLYLLAAHPSPLIYNPDVKTDGLLEENRRLRIDEPDYVNYFVFAYDGMDFYALDLTRKDGTPAYVQVARVGFDVFDRFGSFNDMIVYAIQKHLAHGP